MFAHILAELLKFTIKKGVKDWNSNSLQGITFDKNTKIQVLNDQLKTYFSIVDGQEKIDAENYIQQIIIDLKKDFEFDENKVSIFEDLLFELKYNPDNKKSIQKILSKL